ncbi:MAG: Hint domain-containing protein [Sulfitobacter sp.]
MPTTFDVFYLGVLADMDTVEGNSISENAGALVGTTAGSVGSPIYGDVHSWSPGTGGFSSGESNGYDKDNSPDEYFRIDGGADQKFDSLTLYNATLTYADGTTDTITAVVAQDDAGNAYLLPETSYNADQAALEAKPVTSITFDSVADDDDDFLYATRYDASYAEPDGTVDGTSGDDSIGPGYVDAQGDAVDGWDGDDDEIDAGGGDDTIDSGAGNDNIWGRGGADSIDGGAGDDTIRGNGGNDTIDGGTGDDSLIGGGGSDRFVINDGFGSDTIAGGEHGSEYDALDLSGLSSGATVVLSGDEVGTATDGNDTLSFSQIEEIIGTDHGDIIDGSAAADGMDYVVAGDGDDTIIGTSGNDDLRGQDGNDLIQGGDGSDNLEGGSGDDTVSGGDGHDQVYGNSGDDVLDGGAGDDWFSAGSGQDTISGGTGDDYIELQGDSDRDIVVLEDGFDNDTVYGFDLSDFGDGTTVDQFDISNLTDGGGSPVSVNDITVTDTNGDGTGDAILTFPNGETVTLDGVLASQVDESLELMAIGFVCFATGTLIATPDGDRKIEEIAPGDFVTTRDNGPQQVRWVAASAFGNGDRDLPKNLVPIRIKPGLLGNSRPLIVSQQHCIMMESLKNGETFFVRAKHLAEETTFASFAKGRKQITYCHLLTEQHEVLISNDMPSESFYPGPLALKLLGKTDRKRLLSLLPGLADTSAENAYGPPARPILSRKQLKKHQSESAFT